MKDNITKQIFYHLCLTIIALIIMLLPLPDGILFGNDGDWYSQHVGIAESIRQTILETGSIIPQYIHLGGGSNMYDFAYYGLLRPDILISCILQNVEMKYIIMTYAMVGVLASVNLCYIWLRKQSMSKRFSFFGSILFIASTCFYQAHHQIMFINYMPFLLLALLGIDILLEKNKMSLLIVSLFFIYLHSFYYSISCIGVVCIYAVYRMYQRKEGISKQKLIKIMLAIFISICMAMVLLLPTGLDILSNKKDGGSSATQKLKMVDASLKGLLYTPYGCGTTLLTLYCLLLSLTKKKKRLFALVLLVCMAVPAVSLLLNGFLYARAKILIPFLPLLILLTADTLQDIYYKKQKCYLSLLGICLLMLITSSWRIVVILDLFILLIWVFLQRIKWVPDKIAKSCFGIVYMTPIAASLIVNMSGSYLKSVAANGGINIGASYLEETDSRQEHFHKETIDNAVIDTDYRFDVMANNFVNSNLLVTENIRKSSMYSSVTNTEYANFFYNTMKNPISTNNRVALVIDENPFFSYLMGIKYIVTTKERIPYGYEAVLQNEDYVLVRNDNVLPLYYGTSEIVSQNTFDELEFPYTVETLCNYSVVPDVRNNSSVQTTKSALKQNIRETTPEKFFKDGLPKRLLNPSGKKEKYTLPLNSKYSDEIIILQFHVERQNGCEVVISINGVKNKLSASNAPYPNKNNDFTYILSPNNAIDELIVDASAGDYQISNLKIYTMKQKSLGKKDVVIPKEKVANTSRKESIYCGEIAMSKAGYFITSLPYRKGYQILVDGKETKAIKVNTAFVGFPIEEGQHNIEIRYIAPGYVFGSIISGLFFLIFCVIVILENKGCRKQKKVNILEESFLYINDENAII